MSHEQRRGGTPPPSSGSAISSLFRGHQFFLLGFDGPCIYEDAALSLAAQASDGVSVLSSSSSASLPASFDRPSGLRARDRGHREDLLLRQAAAEGAAAGLLDTLASARDRRGTGGDCGGSGSEEREALERRKLELERLASAASDLREAMERVIEQHSGRVVSRRSPGQSSSDGEKRRQRRGENEGREEEMQEEEERFTDGADAAAQNDETALAASERSLEALVSADFVICNYGAAFVALRRLVERLDMNATASELGDARNAGQAFARKEGDPELEEVALCPASLRRLTQRGWNGLGEFGEAAAGALSGVSSFRPLKKSVFLDRRRLLSPFWLFCCVADSTLYHPLYSPFFSVSASFHPALPPLLPSPFSLETSGSSSAPPFSVSFPSSSSSSSACCESMGGENKETDGKARDVVRIFLLGSTGGKRRVRLGPAVALRKKQRREEEREREEERGETSSSDEGGDGWFERFGLLDRRDLEAEENVERKRRAERAEKQRNRQRHENGRRVRTQTDFVLLSQVLACCGAQVVTRREIEALGARRQENRVREDPRVGLPVSHVVVCSPRALERCLRPRLSRSEVSPCRLGAQLATQRHLANRIPLRAERSRRASGEDRWRASAGEDQPAEEATEKQRRREERFFNFLAGLEALRENAVPFLSLQWIVHMYQSGIPPPQGPYLLQLPPLPLMTLRSSSDSPKTPSPHTLSSSLASSLSSSLSSLHAERGAEAGREILSDFVVFLSVCVAVKTPALIQRCREQGCVSVVVVPPLLPLCASLLFDLLGDLSGLFSPSTNEAKTVSLSQSSAGSLLSQSFSSSRRVSSPAEEAQGSDAGNARAQRRKGRRADAAPKRGGRREEKKEGTETEAKGRADSDPRIELDHRCQQMLQGTERAFDSDELHTVLRIMAAPSDNAQPLLVVGEEEFEAGLVGYVAHTLECFYTHRLSLKKSSNSANGRDGRRPLAASESLVVRVKREPGENASSLSSSRFSPWGVMKPALMVDLAVPPESRRRIGASASRVYRHQARGREEREAREKREARGEEESSSLLMTTPDGLESCWRRHRRVPGETFSLQSFFPHHLLDGFAEDLLPEDLQANSLQLTEGEEEREQRRLLAALEADVVIMGRGDSQDLRTQRRKLFQENQERRMQEALRCHELYLEAGRKWRELLQESERKAG
ncbi:hypothetical protein TGME49_244300 [Toxoplasma gondii ME49]|uniref:Uncharacterized protein n=1 Tax=Toxoplasma gondii (strain ATCC 50611 / Me49) TaxID=508771 RepID=S8F740_TOXGM|nr:hypothetical protein TGME49_244300 [Toxoplasma gondii ME49]EPT30552.1 hypothetical protein TGME49_244300 [Toxoplasma gondii ME49]|eukprot:XP_002366919.1 hypothetical protein TGME49_244300 [Toxoplasma gondii ME49]